MKKIIFLVVVLGVGVFLTGAGCSNKTENSNQAQENENANVVMWETFSNADGGYSFDYPNNWNAEANEEVVSNSLFGPDATGKTGLGGVEVVVYSGTASEYLDYLGQNSEATYSDKEDVTINGMNGVRAQYQGAAKNGHSVILVRDGQVYNIYIGTTDTDDVATFDMLVESFMFY